MMRVHLGKSQNAERPKCRTKFSPQCQSAKLPMFKMPNPSATGQNTESPECQIVLNLADASWPCVGCRKAAYNQHCH